MHRSPKIPVWRLDHLLPRRRLESIAVALAADVTAMRDAEMARHDERAVVGLSGQESRAGLARIIGQHAEGRVPGRTRDLHHAVENVGAENALLALRAHAIVQHAGRVADGILDREKPR